MFLFLIFVTLLCLSYSLDERFHSFQHSLLALTLCALFEPVEDSLRRKNIINVQDLDDFRENREEVGVVVDVKLDSITVRERGEVNRVNNLFTI